MPRPRATIGSIGLPLFAGKISLDVNPRLRGKEAIKVYRQMAADEPAATAFLGACRTLLRTDLAVQPGADPRHAEHVERCLTEMRDSAAVKLRQLYSMIAYGYDIHEIVYRRRSDGTVGWADWALRRQESYERWEVDGKGQIVAWTQRPAPDYVLRTIPLAKALHVVANDDDGTPEGVSALRGMYRLWRFVSNFEWLLGVGLERGVGLPVFSRTDSGVSVTDAQLDELEDEMKAIRQNEVAGVLEPPGIKFRFEPMPGLTAESYLDAIQRFRVWMLATVLSDFIALGTQGGSYALSKDKTELFLMALNGYQDRVCEAINKAIVRLLRANGWPTEEPPTVTLPAVRKYDLSAVGTFAKALSDIGAFHPTAEDEAMFRRMADFVDVPQEELDELFEAEPPPALRREAVAMEPDDEAPDEVPEMEDDDAGEPGSAAAGDAGDDGAAAARRGAAGGRGRAAE